MAYTKVKQAIIEAVKLKTRTFNENTFPQSNPEWSPEQLAIYEYLNGESSSFKEIHVSHQGEIIKNLSKIAGLTITSRFDLNTPVTPPPYTTIILREKQGNYPAHFPLVASKLRGYWTETGGGSSDPIDRVGKNLRPATDDEVHSFFKAFPDTKLPKLYGALSFDETKLREALSNEVYKITETFFEGLKGQWPEGITEKGRQVLELLTAQRSGQETIQIFSIILDDPAMTGPFKKPASEVVEFPAFCAIIPIANSLSHNYELGHVYVKADIKDVDVFFKGAELGNHMDRATSSFKMPTPEEVQEHFKSLEANSLHLYASCLPEDKIKSLL